MQHSAHKLDDTLIVYDLILINKSSLFYLVTHKSIILLFSYKNAAPQAFNL